METSKFQKIETLLCADVGTAWWTVDLGLG